MAMPPSTRIGPSSKGSEKVVKESAQVAPSRHFRVRAPEVTANLELKRLAHADMNIGMGFEARSVRTDEHRKRVADHVPRSIRDHNDKKRVNATAPI